MKHAWLLAWRYVTFHRWRSLVMAGGIGLTLLLPVSIQLLVGKYEEGLGARAASTPLVCGAKGSRYDLVLSTLYFRGRVPAPLPMSEAQAINESGLAVAVPVLARGSARDFPLVGTTTEYYEHRGLVAAAGTLPILLGDCVVGSDVAARLDLSPGDRLLTDQKNLYDLSKGYPLRMHVSGVLAPSGTPDDGAVFCDLKTAWIAEGHGHGHQEAEEQPEDAVMAEQEGRIVLNASVFEFQEITPENADSFHFHGGLEELPLTGILVLPHSDRTRTQIKGRYRVSETAQLITPSEVMDELLGFVIQIKRFFDANTLLVFAATGLLLGVIVTLQTQVRKREIRTLARIGCAQGTIAKIVSAELGIVLGAGLLAALTGALVLLQVAERFL